MNVVQQMCLSRHCNCRMFHVNISLLFRDEDDLWVKCFYFMNSRIVILLHNLLSTKKITTQSVLVVVTRGRLDCCCMQQTCFLRWKDTMRSHIDNSVRWLVHGNIFSNNSKYRLSIYWKIHYFFKPVVFKLFHAATNFITQFKLTTTSENFQSGICNAVVFAQ